MKKISQLLIVTVLIVCLGACGKNSSEEKTVYENNSNVGIKSIITYYHYGDKVIKQTTENVMNYKETGLQDKETAEKAMEAAGSNQYKNVKGIEYSIKYKEKEAIEELSVDYDKLDYEAVNKIPGFHVSGDAENGVSLKASEKLLEASGCTKK